MSIFNYKAIHDSWMQEDDQMLLSLLSPSISKHWEQIVLFPESKDDDYAVEAELTLLNGEALHNVLYKEGGIIVRYSGENRYYYAGLGGFGARTFIGMVEEQNGKSIWSRLASQGKKEQVDFRKPYRLRVECQGSKIALYEDDKQLLAVEDDTYSTGYWGFRTVRTQARFAGVRERSPSIPKCFVIMPFTPSLSFVYETIKKTVISEGLDCKRADEFAVAQPIIDDIKKHIADADLVIADLTGKNANVYYEAGFTHALGKRLILIAQSRNDLAFDVGYIRAVIYSSPKELREKLKPAIRENLGQSKAGEETP